MRWVRGIGALVALCLVIAGAPVALAGWGRMPVGWPAALTRPDDGSVLLVALTLLGWLAWAAFTLSIATEAARLVSSGRVRLRIPLLGGLQQLSTGLLLAVLALAPSSSGYQPPPERVVALGAATLPEIEPEPDEDTPDDTYRVAPGDDLWTVSERLLGDGGRWRELAEANPGKLADPTRPLTPGTRLSLPASPAAAPLTVRVHRGDTLSGIALEHLGSAGRWPRIAAANEDLIDDPDHIEIGWRLVVPGAQPAPRSVRPEARPESREDAKGDGGDTDPPLQRPDLAPESAQTVEPAVSAEPTITASEAPITPAEEPAAPLAPLLGTLGTLAAAAIVGALEARRFLRLRVRPVGRRLIPPDEQASRLRVAMGSRQQPDRLVALDAALRAIGQHCYTAQVPLPEIERIEVDDVGIVLHWATRTGTPPDGFDAATDGTSWSISLEETLLGGDHPCPYPAVVSLGSSPDGRLLLVDAERSRVLGIAAAEPELSRSTMAAMGVELGCAPWAQEVRLVVCGEGAELVRLAGGDRVLTQSRIEDAVAQVHLLAARRRAALRSESLAVLRVDPDRADAVAPVVFLLLDDVPAEVAEELDRLLKGPALGIAVILATGTASPAQWTVTGDPYAPTGRLAGAPGTLQAHAIPEATRRGVASLFRAADDPATTQAPWWSGEDANVLALPHIPRRGEEPVDVVRLVPANHPRVLLIGPTDLLGATGPEPARSRQHLIEFCAWLLEHPDSSPTAMAAGLQVAEGTRRSNLSRLRSWLGDDPEGKPYLPDAYSGRIMLHGTVTSDWHEVQLLLAPGVDRVGDATLLTALEQVRGAPLADAAPGQWHWAEELRTDISSALRDVGVELAERALARGDTDLARWAAARALVVAPEDEQLLCARIRTEHRAGNREDVERLVGQVTRQARILGVDLLPETVEVCQQVIEGRLRAREA